MIKKVLVTVGIALAAGMLSGCTDNVSALDTVTDPIETSENTSESKVPLPYKAATALLPEQIEALRSTEFEIVLPEYVPEGFSVTAVRTEVNKEARFRDTSALIVFSKAGGEDSRDTCFGISSTAGGIGGLPPGEVSYPVSPSAFEVSTLEYGQYGESEDPTLLGQWLGEGPFYRFAGAGTEAELADCNNVDSDEAVKITESFQYQTEL